MGHEFNSKDTSEKYLANAATCADPATYYYKCTRCDAKGNKAYTNGEALGHDFGEYKITTPASCIDTGLKTRACTRCSAFETEVIEKNENNHVGGTETKTEKEATCTETGIEKIYCKSCNAVLETKTLEATDHNFSSKTQTEEYLKAEATCISGKIYYYKCTKCSEKGTETYTAGDALGHTYGEPTFTWSEDLTSATATFKCTSNDDTKTINAVITTEIIKEATCEEEGEIKYTATVKLNGNEYTENRTKEIPASGHEYTEQLTTSTYLASEATCTAPATYYYKCERCTDKGETTYEYGEALDHEFTEVIEDEEHLVSEATCTTPAIYYYDCIRCDVIGTLTYESGDALEHNWNDENPRVCIDCGKVGTETNLVFNQPYRIIEEDGIVDFVFHEDGSYELWIMDFEGYVEPEGSLVYSGDEIIFSNNGQL